MRRARARTSRTRAGWWEWRRTIPSGNQGCSAARSWSRSAPRRLAGYAADLAKGHPLARVSSTTRPARGRSEARPLLLDVRAALLLDEDHAGRPRLRREA